MTADQRKGLLVRAILVALGDAFSSPDIAQASADERADALMAVAGELVGTRNTSAAVRMADGLALAAENPQQALLLATDAIRRLRLIGAAEHQDITQKIVH